MTRYEQLAAIAVSCARQHFENFDACQRFASSLATGYSGFLEYPFDNVVFVHLDKDLNRTEKTESIRLEPPLVFGDDGFWYFCVKIEYENDSDRAITIEYIKLGLKVVGSVATIRGDTDVELDTTSTDSIDEFFHSLFKDSLERFKTLPFLPTKRIDFVR